MRKVMLTNYLHFYLLLAIMGIYQLIEIDFWIIALILFGLYGIFWVLNQKHFKELKQDEKLKQIALIADNSPMPGMKIGVAHSTRGLKTSFINTYSKHVIEDLLIAIQLGEDHAATQFYLGEAYKNIGEYDQALHHFGLAREDLNQQETFEGKRFLLKSIKEAETAIHAIQEFSK